jgi:hypothetical protein
MVLSILLQSVPEPPSVGLRAAGRIRVPSLTHPVKQTYAVNHNPIVVHI